MNILQQSWNNILNNLNLRQKNMSKDPLARLIGASDVTESNVFSETAPVRTERPESQVKNRPEATIKNNEETYLGMLSSEMPKFLKAKDQESDDYEDDYLIDEAIDEMLGTQSQIIRQVSGINNTLSSLVDLISSGALQSPQEHPDMSDMLEITRGQKVLITSMIEWITKNISQQQKVEFQKEIVSHNAWANIEAAKARMVEREKSRNIVSSSDAR